MPEKYLCIEDYLLSVAHKSDQEIEPEPEELIDADWRLGVE